MKRSIAISLVLTGALFGAYFSVVVVGEWAEENKYIYSSPLDYALDYLSDDIYRKIAIEVDWVTGREPDWNAMHFLIERMYEYCDKEEIYIDYNASDEILPLKDTYTLDDLLSLENEYRDLYKNGDTAVIYFLYLNGRYVDTGGYSSVVTEVAGLTYGHSSVAIFKDELRDLGNSAWNEDSLEKTVLLHEFGHIICLVGIGYHSDQEDPEHPHHSIHKGCVMYYAINVSENAPEPNLDFCNDSKKDIEYIKSRDRDVSNVIYIPWLLLAADIISAVAIILSILYPENGGLENQASGTRPEFPEEGDEEMYF